MPWLLYPCLLASGAASLIYELLWTRILSFSFGSTSTAFAVVLAVFFLGLAVGAHVAGKQAHRLPRTLRAYGWLEIGIGLYSAAALPVLFHLDHGFSLVNAGGTEWQGILWRLFLTVGVLGLPTFAMGATFPVLIEYLRRKDAGLASQLGTLYGVNTLGAFTGVYLATHWLIPHLGLTGAYFTAVALNVLVFALSFLLPEPAKRNSDTPQANTMQAGPGLADAPGASPSETQSQWHRAALLLLTVSGFTTLGYEIVWSRVLTIALEGSLYAIGATLGAFLAGIGLGGLAWTYHSRKPRSPHSVFRLYVMVCLAMTAYLALSPFTLTVQGYVLKGIAQAHRDAFGLHLNFLVAILFLLPITGGLGFLFPAALSLLHRAKVTEGAGTAYALNTAASVLGSVLTATYFMNALGIEGIVWINVLLLLGTLAIAVLLVETEPKARWKLNGPLLITLLLVAGFWPEVNAKAVLIGVNENKPASLSGLFQYLSLRFSGESRIKLYKDGVGATITVTQNGRTIAVQNNGLPQSGRSLDPPHFNLESSLVGVLPALHKPEAKDALVIGLGAGITVAVLRKAGIPHVDVVELEPSMAPICRYLYPKNQSPIDDAGVTLHLDDARNFLLRNRYAKQPKRWPLIASQPAHPWVSGAADLFTQDMFRLVYSALDTNGVFGQWFMPSSVDSVSFRAIVNAFGSVFDQVAIYYTGLNQGGIYLVGVKGQGRVDLIKASRLFEKPALHALMVLNQHPDLTDLFKYTLVPLVPGRDLLMSGPINTDGNAWIEAHMPLISKSIQASPKSLPAPVTVGPSLRLFQNSGFAESLFVYETLESIAGLHEHRSLFSEDTAKPQRLTLWSEQAEPHWREYADLLLRGVTYRFSPSEWNTLLTQATGLRLGLLTRLYLRLHPESTLPPWPAELENLPDRLLRDLKGSYALALARKGYDDSALSFLHQGKPAYRSDSALVVILLADAQNRLASRPSPSSETWPRLDSALLDTTLAQSLKRDENDTLVLHALQRYFLAQGNVPRAKMLQGLVAGQKDKRLENLMRLGESQWKAKAYDQAIASFRQALTLNPSLLQAYLNIGQIQATLKNAQAFPELARQVKAAFPLNEVALYRLQEVFEFAATEASQP